MDPSTILSIVAAGGALVSLAAKMIDSPDPAQVLADMRAELAKMQERLGPGGALDMAVAAHNKALDDAIAAAKAAP